MWAGTASPAWDCRWGHLLDRGGGVRPAGDPDRAVGLRRLQNSARIAPLLATIGISFMLDQLVQLVFSPNPQSFPNPLPVGASCWAGQHWLD
jgi:hypothetical protein